ncbi:NlpC/P60 family protein, partial [Actinomadura darangshiensis]
MSIARRSHKTESASGAFAGHTGRGPAATRKQIMLRTAVTATATVTGLALTVPMASQALAALNPTVLQSLHLDSATLKKVQAYDKYRTREASQRKRAKKAMRFARDQIGKPYRWGADGPSGFDCSGLAMAAWRKAGVKIPRVTYSQYSKVDRKVRMKDLKAGDLVFFHGRSHVGLYAGHGRFLHAPHTGAKVRIDKFGARRKKQFAGAVRPGAPAYRQWSPSVRELVEKIDRMSVQKRAEHKPPDKERTPHIPPPADTLPKKSDNPPM